MIRALFVAALLATTTMPANAQAPGDFDCTSDLDGPFTPAGFLDPATATSGPSHPMQMVTDERVNFDDAFADHISPGAVMVEASWFEDAYTYEAAILTAKGQIVLVSCPYIP